MTLVELLVVIGIIGVIVGMGVPALTRYAQQVRLKATTRQVVGLVALARSLAISSHQEHAVVIDQDKGEIRVVNTASGEALEQMIRLPSALSVVMEVAGQPADEMQLTFRPTGSLTGRTVSLTLAEGERQQTVVVTGTTGAVAVQ